MTATTERTVAPAQATAPTPRRSGSGPRERSAAIASSGSGTRRRTMSAVISAASSASSWAEPRCSTIRRTPAVFSTICTAVAPEAVFTLRRYGLTPRSYPAISALKPPHKTP